jgi:putative peptidoglycan lipid II flippase
MLGPWTVIPPFLAEQSAIGDYQKFRDTLSRALAVVIFMAAPLALTLSVLKVSVIELLFERGAFDHRATLGVAGIISGMLVGMIAMICVTLLIKAMHAKDDVKGAALAGGLGATLYLILGASLSSRFGLWGIVVGYVFTWWILLFVCAWRLWGTYFLGKLLRAQFPMVQKLAAALVTLAIALFVSQSMLIRPLAEVGHISLIVRLVAVIVLSLLTFIVAALAFFGGTSGISAFLLGPETPRRSESG